MLMMTTGFRSLTLTILRLCKDTSGVLVIITMDNRSDASLHTRLGAFEDGLRDFTEFAFP